MNAVALGIAVGAFSLSIMVAFIGYNSDMKVCQLSHSYEVCFTALNR